MRIFRPSVMNKYLSPFISVMTIFSILICCKPPSAPEKKSVVSDDDSTILGGQKNNVDPFCNADEPNHPQKLSNGSNIKLSGFDFAIDCLAVVWRSNSISFELYSKDEKLDRLNLMWKRSTSPQAKKIPTKNKKYTFTSEAPYKDFKAKNMDGYVEILERIEGTSSSRYVVGDGSIEFLMLPKNDGDPVEVVFNIKLDGKSLTGQLKAGAFEP